MKTNPETVSDNHAETILTPAQAVARVRPSLVRVEDGSRLTATGILWQDNLIVTTSHGTERDENLAVMSVEGVHHEATLIGRDEETDIAILEISKIGTPLTPVSRALESAISVGEQAIAVALPGNRGLHATQGLVSALQETQTAGQPEVIFRTDAILLPGFSGGVLINLSGQVIGMLNCMYGRGLGVALGTTLIDRVVQTLRTHGKIPHGYLGVRLQAVRLPEGFAQTMGLLLVQVDASSPAAQSGLFLGDTILSISGVALEGTPDIRRHLYAGQATEFSVLRGGEVITLLVTPGSEPA